MRERPSSKTAAGVALIRAFHQVFDGEPKILEDAVAARLLHPEALEWMSSNADSFRTPEARALRSHVVTRSRFAEDALQKAHARGVRQYVILGAGFDSFAYRKPRWAEDLRIFEVDHPASQSDKQARLSAAGIGVPPNLCWAPIDFEATSLDEGLLRCGFDATKPAFISCLGVLVYLTDDAVDQVFRFVASLPPSSEIAFTFAGSSEEVRHPSFRGLADRVAEVGEPLRSYIGEAELVTKLEGLGFSKVTLLSAAEAERRYFHGRTDGLAAPRRARIASARV